MDILIISSAGERRGVEACYADIIPEGDSASSFPVMGYILVS